MTITLTPETETLLRDTAQRNGAEINALADALLADALLAQEQDAADCRAAVEEGFADVEAGRTISLAEEKVRWQQQKADLLKRGEAQAA